jgi:Ca-activated chloride channel family protein
MENLIRTTVLSTRAEKAAVRRNGCRLDTLVQLTTPPPAVAGMRRPVAIALVIDCSGSMAGGKLEAACGAAQQLVRQLTPADRVAVICFDQSIRTVAPLMAPEAAVIEWIAEIRSGGQTDLFSGWRAGVEILLEAPGLERHHKRVLLLTDGQANLGLCQRSQVALWVGQAREWAIHTSCIGLGDTCAEGLLSVMAQTGDGNLVHLTSPEQQVAPVTAELEGLSLCVGRDLRLRLAVGAGCRLRRTYNPIEPDANGWIRLGSLQAGARACLVIQLEVAPEAGASELCDLLQVQARWLDGYGKPQNLAVAACG